MEKSICLNCGAAFDQTPGKREKKFCKPSCRVNYCQKKKVRESKIKFAQSGEESFKGLNNVRKEKPAKKPFKTPTDNHGAGKVVKEIVKKTKSTPAASNFLEQRRKQKLGK